MVDSGVVGNPHRKLRPADWRDGGSPHCGDNFFRVKPELVELVDRGLDTSPGNLDRADNGRCRCNDSADIGDIDVAFLGNFVHDFRVREVVALKADHGAVKIVLVFNDLEGVLGLEGERPGGAASHGKVVADLDRPPGFLGPEARYGREIGCNLDERHRELLDVPHAEVHFAKAAHAFLGKCPAGRITAPGAHTAVNDAGAIVQFMVCAIEFLSQVGQVIEDFECQFVYT